MKLEREMQEKEEMKMKEKRNSIDLQIALNLAVVTMILLSLNLSLLVYPYDEMLTRSNIVRFDWIGLNDVKLDDNPQFTSPIEVSRKNPIVELKPGRYYWKSGLSGTRSFSIESEVSIEVTPAVLENEAAYRIENKGNTRILLNLFGIITGRVVLEPLAVTYETNASNIEKILAEENESR